MNLEVNERTVIKKAARDHFREKVDFSTISEVPQSGHTENFE